MRYYGNVQGPQRCPLNFRFCKLSEKVVRWPSIFIYFNFSDGKGKSYQVELNIFKENAFYGLQKILLDSFSRNFYIWSAIVNDACMQTVVFSASVLWDDIPVNFKILMPSNSQKIKTLSTVRTTF